MPVHDRRFGYEPLFVYDRWHYGRGDPGWEVRMRGDYAFRVAHIDARPPHTYAAALRINVGAGGARFTLAAPIGHIAAGGGAMRFEHINTERREQFVKAQHEIRQVQNDRRNSEIRAGAQARATGGGQPVRMNVRTSAATTSRQTTTGAARAGTGRVTAGGGVAASTATGARPMGPATPRTAAAPARTSNASGKSQNSRDKDKDRNNR